MNALFLTDSFTSFVDFYNEIAFTSAFKFSRLLGDKDAVDTIRGRLVQEFMTKGFGKRPSWWNRFRFGERRFMRIDVDEKTLDVVITNGSCTKNGGAFIPYGTENVTDTTVRLRPYKIHPNVIKNYDENYPYLVVAEKPNSNEVEYWWAGDDVLQNSRIADKYVQLGLSVIAEPVKGETNG